MDINTVTQGLNDICEEVGVCPSKNNGLPTVYQRENNGEAKIIYAAELINGNKTVLVGCYEDNLVTSCYIEGTKMKDHCCHTADEGGMALTKDWVEHLKSNGYRVKEIPVEE
jgi:hypothetical protein